MYDEKNNFEIARQERLATLLLRIWTVHTGIL